MRGLPYLVAAALVAVSGCSTRTSVMKSTSDGRAQLSEPRACWLLPLALEEADRALYAGEWMVTNWKPSSFSGYSPIEDAGDDLASAKENPWVPGREHRSLILVHRQSGAIIEFNTAVASKPDARIDLTTLVRRRVDRLRGNRAVFGVWESGTSVSVGAVERRIAARESEVRATAVGGTPAVTVDVDFIDLDHLLVQPGAVYYKTRMVLTRTPFRSPSVHGDLWERPEKALLRATLTAAPEDFDRHAADFEAMLTKFSIVGAEGKAGDEAGLAFPDCRRRLIENAQAAKGAKSP
jgi:hypothetical protein